MRIHEIINEMEEVSSFGWSDPNTFPLPRDMGGDGYITIIEHADDDGIIDSFKFLYHSPSIFVEYDEPVVGIVVSRDEVTAYDYKWKSPKDIGKFNSQTQTYKYFLKMIFYHL